MSTGIANVLRSKPSDGLSKKDFWRTPPDVTDEIREARGGRMFDVCPSPNPEHWYADTWWDAPHVDALTRSWPSWSFCNPPYSKMAPWFGHAFACSYDFLFLVPPSVCTAYWHEHVWPNMNFLAFRRGRIHFLDEHGVPQKNNPMGSCLVGRVQSVGKLANLSPKRWHVERH